MNKVSPLADDDQNPPGSARLWVAIPVTIFCFFYAGVLDYALPLYFHTWGLEAAEAQHLWSTLVKYKFAPWILSPILAGILARRYGERAVWSGSLLGTAIIPPLLALRPPEWGLIAVSLWQGVTASLMWIAGISLVQMVGARKRGLANGLTMFSVGVGSLAAPMVGRCLVHGHELSRLWHQGAWHEAFRRLFNISQIESKPVASDFTMIFALLTVLTIVGGIAIGYWGQRPGRFDQGHVADWARTVKDLNRLLRMPRFWALVLALCLCGGPIFGASNQFLPMRAEDLGLKHGSTDAGWIWLNLVKTLMWLPGGAAVGLLAGRRAGGIAPVLMLCLFSGTAFAIGACTVPWTLFMFVALYEFVRQFMRWSQSGYLSEHMPSDLRSTAIGLSVTFSGLGATIFLWTADYFYFATSRPDWATACFHRIGAWMGNARFAPSMWPFAVAAVLGLCASLGLFIFDRITPIREPDTPG